MDEGFLKHVFYVMLVEQDAIEVAEHAGGMFIVEALEGVGRQRYEGGAAVGRASSPLLSGREPFFFACRRSGL
jgi:hypothetical protein